jgi:hypothetical protein
MKIFNMSLKHFVISFFFLVLFSNCVKKEELSFKTPSIYKFNGPILEDKTYYVREVGNYRRITDTLVDFLQPIDILADSLNSLVRKYRNQYAIESIEFIDGTNAAITIGKLDTLGQNVIQKQVLKETYQLSGNDVILSNGLKFVLDNGYRELHECYQASDRSMYLYQGDTIVSALRNYDFRACQFTDDKSYITFMTNAVNPFKIDTLAIYKINVIYSNYK